MGVTRFHWVQKMRPHDDHSKFSIPVLAYSGCVRKHVKKGQKRNLSNSELVAGMMSSKASF